MLSLYLNNLHSTRFGRPTEQPRKKIFPTANKSTNPEQILGHIKDDYRALKAKNDKADGADQKSGWHEEVNYVGSLDEIL